MGKQFRKPQGGGFNPNRDGDDKDGYQRRDRPAYHGGGHWNRPPESDAEREARIKEQRRQEAILNAALVTGDRENIMSAVSDVSIGIAVSTMKHILNEIVDNCEPTGTGVALFAQAIDRDDRRDRFTRERSFTSELAIAEFYRKIQLEDAVTWTALKFAAVGYDVTDQSGSVKDYGFDTKPQALRAASGKLRSYAEKHPREQDPDLSTEALEAVAQLFDAFIAERDEKARKAGVNDPSFSSRDRHAARLARSQEMAAQRELERPPRTTTSGGTGPTSMAQALADAGVTEAELELAPPADDTAPLNEEVGGPAAEEHKRAKEVQRQLRATLEAEERARAEAHQDAELAAQAEA